MPVVTAVSGYVISEAAASKACLENTEASVVRVAKMHKIYQVL